MSLPQSILVTGASRGIGLAVARRLLREAEGPLGLSLCARGADALDEAAEQLRRGAREGQRVLAVPMDVADQASVVAGLEKIRTELGDLDGVVLNAGIAESAPLHRTSDEMFERVLAINVGGVFRILREVLPRMKERGSGRVVAVASIAAKVGIPYVAAYCASKHAVLGLVRTAAVEYARDGITVNAVCPGYVDTPLVDAALRNIQEKTGLDREQALEKMVGASPQGRVLHPDEVAAAVCYLLSDDARGVNGTTLDLDGGELAR